MRPVATILELAAHAEVSAETVLRVVNGEPVNEEVERRVRDAQSIEVAGFGSKDQTDHLTIITSKVGGRQLMAQAQQLTPPAGVVDIFPRFVFAESVGRHLELKE